MANTYEHYGDVNEAYTRLVTKVLKYGQEEDSRNGKVISLPAPITVEFLNPKQRVLLNPVRDCNHIFHIMEFVWMMAGRNDAKWISYFNSNMTSYSNNGALFGAYGHRWRKHFHRDQIADVIKLLGRDPKSRQAVINMWDPYVDNPKTKSNDRPCNTQIMFRIVKGYLDMHVINRSNDLIWGMLGANIVHMTLLHELISIAVNVRMGSYYVTTNNLHIYPDMPRGDQILKATDTIVKPNYKSAIITPLISAGSCVNWQQFLWDCESFCDADWDGIGFENQWIWKIAKPAHDAYIVRKTKKGDGIAQIEKMPDNEIWKIGILEWIQRKELAKQK